MCYYLLLFLTPSPRPPFYYDAYRGLLSQGEGAEGRQVDRLAEGRPGQPTLGLGQQRIEVVIQLSLMENEGRMDGGDEEMWAGRQGPAIPLSGLMPFACSLSSPTLSILHPLSTYRIAHALLVGDFDGDICEFRRAVALQAAQTEGGGGRGGGSEDSQAQEGRRGLAEHD